MRISKIQLKNGYKRFYDLTIDLGNSPKKIIALVGPNGSGKSSVFDGMIFHASAHQQLGSYGIKDWTFHSMTDTEIGYQSVDIQFNTGKNYQQAIQEKWEENRQNNTIFSLRNSYRYNSNLNVKEQRAIDDIRKNNNGASSTVDLDDKMTQNYQRLVVYVNSYRKAHGLTDEQAIEQVLGELNTILGNCLGLELVDAGDIMAGRGTLYFKKTTQPKEFSFNVLSSGEKEVVDIFLDIFLKREEFRDTIYLIDEPELHLNTSIQKKVLVEIAKLIPDNCQIWIATHSIGFLNALQNELSSISDIIDFDGNFSFKTDVLMPMRKTRTNWQKVFKTALEDLTGLLSPNRIIYCEGRAEPTSSGDDQGLDADVYNEIFAETHPESLFISSGGNTEPDKYAGIALSVLNKAFKDVEIIVLKDKDINRDASPTTDQQREDYIAKDPKMIKMLKRREIENYLFDFEVLGKAYGISQTDYKDIISDSQGDVKAKTGDLMKFFKINTGMNAEGFKKHLATFVTPDTAVYKELHDLIF